MHYRMVIFVKMVFRYGYLLRLAFYRAYIRFFANKSTEKIMLENKSDANLRIFFARNKFGRFNDDVYFGERVS